MVARENVGEEEQEEAEEREMEISCNALRIILNNEIFHGRVSLQGWNPSAMDDDEFLDDILQLCEFSFQQLFFIHLPLRVTIN